MTKSEIREQIAQTKKLQTLEPYCVGAHSFFQRLETIPKAESIGAYMPLPDEVDVTPLFQTLEHQFFVPAFDEASGGYRMAQFSKDWKKGKFGIAEPAEPIWAKADELDLILVPGVAFDRDGNRLGRGGGFYDRLLPQYTAVRAGICFDFQILESLPSEEHDCKMDFLISESEILKIQ